MKAVMDEDIANRIHELVDEEHQLHSKGGAPLNDVDRDRLSAIEVQLDQCWDLLRQRRARRAAGSDPADAAVRPESVVERYQQ
jgi:hypothetical protein